MAQIDIQYRDLCVDILRNGFSYRDPTRGNIGMLQVPSYLLDIDVAKEFPLLTSKKMFWKGIVAELVWILTGQTDVKFLQDQGVHIWDEDAKRFSGGVYAGRVYGAQLRDWTSVNINLEPCSTDQLTRLVQGLKETPFNRRHIVTMWNPGELHMMALPPCPWAWEVLPYQEETGAICFVLKWHQRSVDTFLGLPFDIAHYGLLGLLIEAWTGYTFTRLIGDLSNVHFYEPHLDAVQTQLGRPVDIPAPAVWAVTSRIQDLSLDTFYLQDYRPAPTIKAKLFTPCTTSNPET